MQSVVEVLLQYDQHVHGVLRPASQNDNWCLSKLLTSSGMCTDNQEPARSSSQRTTLFSKVRGPEMGQLGKTGVWMMPMSLLQEPCCASPVVLKSITCFRFTAHLKYQKRIIEKKPTQTQKEKRETAVILHFGEEKLGTTNQIVQNHSGIA